jgi:formylglycine-generating enzyme required for sulfatase activity
MQGNVWQWVEDTWHGDYRGAPIDGMAWTEGGKESSRVVRGGSWIDDPESLRSAYRVRSTTFNRIDSLGFRVGRTLTP